MHAHAVKTQLGYSKESRSDVPHRDRATEATQAVLCFSGVSEYGDELDESNRIPHALSITTLKFFVCMAVRTTEATASVLTIMSRDLKLYSI